MYAYADDRVHLGGDELAICGQLRLSDKPITILNVGNRYDFNEGKFGPYDIDGSGVMRSFDKPYLLVAQHSNEADPAAPPETRFLSFDVGEEVTLGRSEVSGQQLGLGDDPEVSRKHAKLKVNPIGVIEVSDLGSKNGTSLQSAKQVLGIPVSSDYGYTHRVSDDIHAAGKMHAYQDKHVEAGWGNGMYGNRPIIGRDTPVNGGVYPVGTAKGEALVIDDEKYPKELNEVYDKVMSRLRNIDEKQFGMQALHNVLRGKDRTQQTLQQVYEVVAQTLRYDIPATDALASDNKRIALNVYISQGVGVCRTQAALSAYVVERMVNQGALEGKVSIDRNSTRDVDGTGGGHAWARFRSADGQVYIIDPAQHFVGRISDRTEKHWDYRRTEDVLHDMLRAQP
jgi:hypothetical protein